MLNFDKKGIVTVLQEMPASACSAFAAACAARLTSVYRIVQSSLGQGDPDILDTSLDRVWSFCMNGTAADWNALADALVGLIPDEEEGASFLHSVIDDALAAGAYAIRSVASSGPEQAAWAAQRVYDAVDRFAGQTLDAAEFTELVESALLESAVVQQELRRQQHDLTLLKSSSPADLVRTIATLRARTSNTSALPIEDVERIVKSTKQG